MAGWRSAFSASNDCRNFSAGDTYGRNEFSFARNPDADIADSRRRLREAAGLGGNA
jgi:hypothetical protein